MQFWVHVALDFVILFVHFITIFKSLDVAIMSLRTTHALRRPCSAYKPADLMTVCFKSRVSVLQCLPTSLYRFPIYWLNATVFHVFWDYKCFLSPLFVVPIYWLNDSVCHVTCFRSPMPFDASVPFPNLLTEEETLDMKRIESVDDVTSAKKSTMRLLGTLELRT